MPRQVRIGSSHHQGCFTKRRFNQGETAPKTITLQSTVKRRVRLPSDDVVHEVAHRFAGSACFREHKKRQFELGRETRLANFMKFYKFVAERKRHYRQSDAIEIDLYLGLREFVKNSRRDARSVDRRDLETEARRLVDECEQMIIGLADGFKDEDIVLRPMAPKDARERGAEAYTEAAANRYRDARIKDRVTIKARLPGSSEIIFVTLGPATRSAHGRTRVKCDRKILAIQSTAEWNAWRKNRVREKKQEFRNDRHRGQSSTLN